jgi:hypothetical protein
MHNTDFTAGDLALMEVEQLKRKLTNSQIVVMGQDPKIGQAIALLIENLGLLTSQIVEVKLAIDDLKIRLDVLEADETAIEN